MPRAYRLRYTRPYRGVDNHIHWEAVDTVVSVGPDSTIEEEIDKIKQFHVVDRDFCGKCIDHYCAKDFTYEQVPQLFDTRARAELLSL